MINHYSPYIVASAVLHAALLLYGGAPSVEPPRFSMEADRGGLTAGAVVELVAPRPRPATKHEASVTENDLPVERAPDAAAPRPEAPLPKPRTKPERRKTAPKPKPAVKESLSSGTSSPPLAESSGSVTDLALENDGKGRSSEGAVTVARPDYLRNPAPKYPASARRLKREGLVELRVAVDAAGNAEAVSLARSSGFSALDEAALVAVKKWRFKPAMRGQVPVPSTIVVPVRFMLDQNA